MMNNAVFRKTVENLRKHRDIKLVPNEAKRNFLLTESNYHTRKISSHKLLPKEMKRTLMTKPVYLCLSILEISKIVMYEFWCDYVKPKYQENAKLCYMDAGSLIIYIKTEDICADIAKDVEQDLVLQVLN